MDKLREILEAREKDRLGDLTIKPNIKAGHGTCCTCQVCGYDYDNCNCDIREAVKWIDQAHSAILKLFKQEMLRLIGEDRKPVPELEGSGNYRRSIVSNNITAGYNFAKAELRKKVGEI